MRLIPPGSIYWGGQTSSVDFPVQNALQSHNSGGQTGWLARFYQPLDLLTLTVTPPGGGTVSAAPSAVGGYYAHGASVQITASPAAGYSFTGFSGALSGTAKSANSDHVRPDDGDGHVCGGVHLLAFFNERRRIRRGRYWHGGFNRIQSRLRVHGFQQRGMAHYHGVRQRKRQRDVAQLYRKQQS
ncbi:MAG TPA: hypothetical protein VEV85_15030 [Bryobacteraceae bacterium]|nr:hypothetical protein [Bryobacteraceae bacterium]